MVLIGVDDAPTLGEGRDDHEGNARSVAKEVDRLEETGVPIAAALVEGDEERGLRKQLWMTSQLIENAIDQCFKQIEFRACWMAIGETVGLEIGNRRQAAAVDVGKEIDCILDMRLALRRIAHDRFGILERIADVAIPVAARPDQHVEWIG